MFSYCPPFDSFLSLSLWNPLSFQLLWCSQGSCRGRQWDFQFRLFLSIMFAYGSLHLHKSVARNILHVGNIHYRWRVLWLGSGVQISFSCLSSTSLIHKDLNRDEKPSSPHQLNISMFSELSGSCFGNDATLSSSEGNLREEKWLESRAIWWNDGEIWCIGNFLESIRVTLVRALSKERYNVSMAIFINETRFQCWNWIT